MEGLFFYWFAWIGWIWTTFLMSKDHFLRFRLSIWLLIMMVLSPYQFLIQGFEIHLSAVVLMVFFIVHTYKLRYMVFGSVCLSAFIIMIGYVSFLLFELYDPVWVIFDRKWMIAFGAMVLSSVLQENIYYRVYALISGMVLGELLYAVLLRNLSFHYPVSSLAFLDLIALMLMLISIWAGFSSFMTTTGNYINYGKGKQKST